MTIDEAIKHCEEVMMENLEKTEGRNASDPIAINCGECAEEHHQLAEWLKELKAYREQSGDEELDFVPEHKKIPCTMIIGKSCGDAISRQAAIVQLSHNKIGDDDSDVIIQKDIETIKAMPPVNPQQKVGRWIEYVEPDDAEPLTLWRCDNCDTVERRKTLYCPMCGAKMVEPQESEDTE